MCNPLIFISSSAGAILPFYCPFLGSFPRLFAFLPILFRIFHYCIHCMYRYTFLLQMFDMARLRRFSQNVLNTCMPNAQYESQLSLSCAGVTRDSEMVVTAGRHNGDKCIFIHFHCECEYIWNNKPIILPIQ